MEHQKLPEQGSKGETHRKGQPRLVSGKPSSFGTSIAVMLAALAIVVGLGLRTAYAANSTAAVPPNSIVSSP